MKVRNMPYKSNAESVKLEAAHSVLFDPDLPTASAVMATLNCVAVRYAQQPSLELAFLASGLAYTLTAPEYAENKLIEEVARNLVFQWDQVLLEHQEASSDEMADGRLLQ